MTTLLPRALKISNNITSSANRKYLVLQKLFGEKLIDFDTFHPNEYLKGILGPTQLNTLAYYLNGSKISPSFIFYLIPFYSDFPKNLHSEVAASKLEMIASKFNLGISSLHVEEERLDDGDVDQSLISVLHSSVEETLKKNNLDYVELILYSNDDMFSFWFNKNQTTMKISADISKQVLLRAELILRDLYPDLPVRRRRKI